MFTLDEMDSSISHDTTIALALDNMDGPEDYFGNTGLELFDMAPELNSVTGDDHLFDGM